MATAEDINCIRQVRVEMWKDDSLIVNADNLAVDFVVTRTCAAVFDKATINISNLTAEHLRIFTVPWLMFRENDGTLKGSHLGIKLFAGYASEEKIFEGYITEALPSGTPPDITLNCVCRAHFNLDHKIVTLTGSRDDTLETLLDALKKACGWKEIVWKADPAYRKLKMPSGKFAARGTLTEVLRAVDRNFPAVKTYFESFGTIGVCNNEKAPAAESTVLKAGGKEYGALPVIGLPKGHQFGVSFTTLLNPSAELNQKAVLSSVMIPEISGEYYIKTITHRGSSRGNAFYTEYVCQTFPLRED